MQTILTTVGIYGDLMLNAILYRIYLIYMTKSITAASKNFKRTSYVQFDINAMVRVTCH